MTKKEIENLRAKHAQKVKGVFKFYEVPGGTLSFVFKEFPGDKVEKYELVDGQTYELPLGVAKHLNNNCNYPIHKHATDEFDKPLVTIGQRVSRAGFHSLDFVDIVKPEQNIII